MKSDKKPLERQALSLLGNTPKSVFPSQKQENLSSNTTMTLEKEVTKVPKSQGKIGVSPLEQTLKNALKEAIEENELLRKRVMELEALYAAAEDEIEKKDKALLELYEALVQKDQDKSASKEIIKKTEKFFKDPQNLITLDIKNMKKQSLNNSF